MIYVARLFNYLRWDITYLPLGRGANLYLAAVIDCCSQRAAGWAIAEHMRAPNSSPMSSELPTRYVPVVGGVFYVEHGSHYTPEDSVKRCTKLGVI